jgi:hypothetical protein
MNYQQALKADGTVDPNCITVISDAGDYRTVRMSMSDPLWIAYLNWLAAGNTPLSGYIGPLSTVIKTLCSNVDTRVATIYSQWSRFQAEYEAREQAAQAFKDGGYAGDPGIYVTGFATAAGMTNQAAADLILSQATTLNGALAMLGALRMRKYEILKAANAAAAQEAYDDIMAAIQIIAAGIQ